MPDLNTHCIHTKTLLGDECRQVHQFIDQYFSTMRLKHRKMLHHWEGINECAEKMKAFHGGDIEFWRKAATLHVKLDFTMGDFPGGQFPIPHKSDYDGGTGEWPTKKPWV